LLKPKSRDYTKHAGCLCSQRNFRDASLEFGVGHHGHLSGGTFCMSLACRRVLRAGEAVAHVVRNRSEDFTVVWVQTAEKPRNGAKDSWFRVKSYEQKLRMKIRARPPALLSNQVLWHRPVVEPRISTLCSRRQFPEDEPTMCTLGH